MLHQSQRLLRQNAWPLSYLVLNHALSYQLCLLKCHSSPLLPHNKKTLQPSFKRPRAHNITTPGSALTLTGQDFPDSQHHLRHSPRGLGPNPPWWYFRPQAVSWVQKNLSDPLPQMSLPIHGPIFQEVSLLTQSLICVMANTTSWMVPWPHTQTTTFTSNLQ